MTHEEMTIKDIDRKVYAEIITPWLPKKIIDSHVHVGTGEGSKPISDEHIKASWVLEVGYLQTWEQLRNKYRALFPDQEVSMLAFGNVYYEVNADSENEYIYHGMNDRRNKACALWVTRPETHPAKIVEAMSRGFLGIKPYPDFVDGKSNEVSIYDFLPKSHLSVVNDMHGIVMLHLPRAGRLGDPNNIKEIVEISNAYPNIKLIIAHIGRAYCISAAERGLPHMVDLCNVYFDTSANLNADVFQLALETVGPDRLLYGTDLPGMILRGVREYSGDDYINYTDGPYSWNKNRKSPEEEANYTFYVYEELKSLIKAIKSTGYGINEMKKIMYTNGAKLLSLPVDSREVVTVGTSY